MTTPDTLAKLAACPNCAYCYKPIETPVMCQITDIGWDNVRHKQYVRKRELEFCSNEHASHYQMGCEG